MAEAERMIPAGQPHAGQQIREARIAKGMSQAQLSAALYEHGYRIAPNPVVISKIENGHRPVPVLMRAHLEHVLGIQLPRPGSAS